LLSKSQTPKEEEIMKSNTIVFIALRNIGDSSDSGELFEGQLKEGILWLAAALGSKSMAKRFAIGIGRDKAGAEAAIDLKRNNARFDAAELGDELDRLLAGDSPEDIIAGVKPVEASTTDPRDTWNPER
jgi:hypothetical protein